MKQKLTKKPMEKVVIFRASVRDIALFRAAAGSEEISQSQLLREALRERASRILASESRGDDTQPPQAA